MPTVDRTLLPLHRSVRATLLAATLIVGGGTLAIVGGCVSSGATPGPVTIDAASPESLLASLKAAAGQSFNRYLEALRTATDCERLPDFCRLLQAREDAAREMVELRDAMADTYGAYGANAGTIMLRSAYLEQFEAIERASVFSSGGDLAILRIGTEVYRMRLQPVGWRIVQFPDPPYDPAVSADAIEILVARIDAIRQDVLDGRITDMEILEGRIAGAMGG
ncbi:hypothetical protein OAG01_00385 [bacterium]|nr:hypothetical protein [bacterium]MDB4632882.1 hypothetical protein [bacterium]